MARRVVESGSHDELLAAEWPVRGDVPAPGDAICRRSGRGRRERAGRNVGIGAGTVAEMVKSVRALWLMTLAAFRADPRTALAAWLVTLAENAALPVLAYCLKGLVDAAAHGDIQNMMLILVMLAGGLIGRHVASLLGFALRNGLRERTSLLVQMEFARVTAGIAGIEHFERPEYLKEMDLLREQHERLAWVQQSGQVLAGLLVQIGFTLVLLAEVEPWLVVLPLLGIPSLILSAKAWRGIQDAWEAVSERRRLEWHLFRLATTAKARQGGPDLRAGAGVLQRHQQVRHSVDGVEDRACVRLVMLSRRAGSSSGWRSSAPSSSWWIGPSAAR